MDGIWMTILIPRLRRSLLKRTLWGHYGCLCGETRESLWCHFAVNFAHLGCTFGSLRGHVKPCRGRAPNQVLCGVRLLPAMHASCVPQEVEVHTESETVKSMPSSECNAQSASRRSKVKEDKRLFHRVPNHRSLACAGCECLAAVARERFGGGYCNCSGRGLKARCSLRPAFRLSIALVLHPELGRSAARSGQDGKMGRIRETRIWKESMDRPWSALVKCKRRLKALRGWERNEKDGQALGRMGRRRLQMPSGRSAVPAHARFPITLVSLRGLLSGPVAKHFPVVIIQKQSGKPHPAPHSPAPRPFHPPHRVLARPG